MTSVTYFFMEVSPVLFFVALFGLTDFYSHYDQLDVSHSLVLIVNYDL